MSLWKIAFRSIQQRWLASLLTAISMGLGVGLVVTVLVVGGAAGKSFSESASTGYNMIIGAKGGRLDLVFNTVYRLSRPIENIPYSFYQEFLPAEKRSDGKPGSFSMGVDRAVPLCMGDFFREFRVVGTTPEYFLPLPNGRTFTFTEGEVFTQEDWFGAVVGSAVAKQEGLTLGSKIQPAHGAVDGKVHEEDEFIVRGILAPTGSPDDRAVFVNMEGFFLLDGHSKPVEGEVVVEENLPVGPDGRTALPESQREVTSMLVRLDDEWGLLIASTMMNQINEGNIAQAVSPIREVSGLYEVIVDPIETLLRLLTGLIVIVASLSIVVGMYNSMNERKHEIAVMRALGANRQTVSLVILFESILLSLLGGLIGWVLGHIIVASISPLVQEVTGVYLGLFTFVPKYELILIPALVLLATIVGCLPAISAYRTDVAKSLTANA